MKFFSIITLALSLNACVTAKEIYQTDKGCFSNAKVSYVHSCKSDSCIVRLTTGEYASTSSKDVKRFDQIAVDEQCNTSQSLARQP